MNNKDYFKKAVEKIGSLNSLILVMESYNINFRKDSSGYYTNCIFHNDKTPSLRLGDKGNRAIYNCFGCGEQGDIINFICKMDNVDNMTALKKAYNILGLELNFNIKTISDNKVENFKKYIRKSKFKIVKDEEIYILDDIYIYGDENNKPLYCKIKYKNEDGKKYFITKYLSEIDIGFKYGESKDFERCRKVIYNLSQIKKAVSQDSWIFFVEGEKDVETLKKLNIPATTIYTKKWEVFYDNDLKDSKVAFIGDSGKSGKEFKNFVVEKLKKCCKGLKIIDLPGLEKIGNGKNKDVTDWLESGKTCEDIKILLKKSLNILDKNILQQDEKGIYKISNEIKNNEEIEVRYNLTNFKIIDAVLFRNKDTNEHIIKMSILSSDKIISTIEADARELFSDIKVFRKHLGIYNIFYGDNYDFIRLHQWILSYFIKEEISIFTKTGIRKINNEYVLITNKGVLKKNGCFYTDMRSINMTHNVDFTDVKVLNKNEAEKLSKYLFNFNSKKNVYNTLGLGIANMLNYFVRQSSLDNLPILQNVGESNSGKSKALTILKLLFNNTNPPISFLLSTDISLLKSLDETYLPIFLDEVKISKISNCKINSLENHILGITEGYENNMYSDNLTIHKFMYNASLIMCGEEINYLSVKNRSNIVFYNSSNFNNEGWESVDFLCNSEEGKELLRRFSKSLYLQVLNNYTDENFVNEYLMTKCRYNFEEKPFLHNSKKINTIVYTMMGLELIRDTFKCLGVDINLNLEEAFNIISNI